MYQQTRFREHRWLHRTPPGPLHCTYKGGTGMTNCAANPKQGPATTSGATISTCPDRVSQFIASNTSLNKLSNIPSDTRNRLLFTGSLPTTINPIDNQRFFVWQHYADFLVNEPEPDPGGLDFWTGNITGTCGTGFNDNNSCTHTKRIDVSRAFWAAAFPSLFIGGGTQLTDNLNSSINVMRSICDVLFLTAMEVFSFG